MTGNIQIFVFGLAVFMVTLMSSFAALIASDHPNKE